MFERTVIGPFRISGKTAAGELAAFQVITDTVATETFPGAGIISTQAVLQILLFLALHFLLLTLRDVYLEGRPPMARQNETSLKHYGMNSLCHVKEKKGKDHRFGLFLLVIFVKFKIIIDLLSKCKDWLQRK